ncbi:TIGR01440 family protein [Bacillus kwashiorkori]|uniref:TIGR01440 family protein n=1 Tax=Bacillus kwashiorkori TaxID=1522318 RepID=UPI000782150F|nr:TIGR01440 family protein [Bacillus kwashiorkori]
MLDELKTWGGQLEQILADFSQHIDSTKEGILVIGCSTSEVAGKQIGTSGSEQIAAMIFEKLQQFATRYNVNLAFQCCEHLNRALVIERTVQEKHQWEEVTVVPVANAGGSMATMAYKKFTNPVVVEHIKADYGIDIGDTFIGMHLKHVAVPVRVSVKALGSAHVTLAKTRPKLIGGERAVYQKTIENNTCH